MNSVKYSLSAVGATPPIAMSRSLISQYQPVPFTPVGVICNVSDNFVENNNGGSGNTGLRYIIEVTGDDPAEINDSSWVTYVDFRTGDQVFGTVFPVTAIRARVVLFHSGTLTFSVIQ